MRRGGRTRRAVLAVVASALATSGWSQTTGEPPRLVRARVSAAPWNVQSGGISACEVVLDERGEVVSAELVQDIPPYGVQFREDVLSFWTFEPAREGGRPVGARVLALGFFLPPTLSVHKPEKPLYETTKAPLTLPWPKDVVVPPYPPNVTGSGTVIMEAEITEQGVVAAARVLSPGSAFDSAALDTVRRWVFRPAVRAGRPVGSRVFLVVSFPVVTP